MWLLLLVQDDEKCFDVDNDDDVPPTHQAPPLPRRTHSAPFVSIPPAMIQVTRRPSLPGTQLNCQPSTQSPKSRQLPPPLLEEGNSRTHEAVELWRGGPPPAQPNKHKSSLFHPNRR